MIPRIDERLRSHIPALRPDERAQLEENLLREGCREPLTVWDGLLVDGHNRLEICNQHGLSFDTRDVSFPDMDTAIAWIEENQLGRRNLTADSFAYFIGRKYERLKKAEGRPIANKLPQNEGVYTDQLGSAETAVVVAADHGISRATVERAASFARNVDAVADALGENVRPVLLSGEEKLTRQDVAEIAVVAPQASAEKLVFDSPKAALDWAKSIRTERAKERRAETDAVRAAPAAVPEGKFGTIIIDPPWDMQKIERDVRPAQVGFDYPTMSEDELRAFPLADMAADDCHLFCWTTHKFLPSALRLCEAWGFRYVLTMVWHKPGGFQPIGLPQYNCEFVIYARKGAPSFADTKAFSCAFHAPRREHSRKPDEFYELIQRVTDEGRVDVFSREARIGFAQFGNEADKFSGAA